MYFMLSSSQPLIRTFWSSNLSHPFERWLGFCYLSFLFKGESFSFVRGLWLLGLDNRKNFFCGYFWISFASGVLWWWLESLLHPSIWVFVVRSIYSWNLCLVYRRATSLGRFCRGSSTCLLGFACIRRLSLVSLWSMILTCYFSVTFVHVS